MVREHVPTIVCAPATERQGEPAFLELLSSACALAERTGEVFAVHCFELEGVGWIAAEEREGRIEELLRQVWERLSGIIRGSDILSQVGDRQFALLQREVKSTMGAITLIQRILDQLSEPFTVGGEKLEPPVSVGTTFHSVGAEPAALVDQAREALARARVEPDCSYRFHRRDLEEAAVRLQAELRSAIEGDELFFEYQRGGGGNRRGKFDWWHRLGTGWRPYAASIARIFSRGGAPATSIREPDFRTAHFERVSAQELAKRSFNGSLAYAIAMAVLVTMTRIGADYTVLSTAIVGLLAVTGALRLWLRFRFAKLYGRIGERAVRWFLALMALQGLTWGLAVAAIILRYGVSAESLWALSFAVATVAIGTQTLAARIGAVLLFQLCAQLPPAAALVWIGVASHPTTVIAVVLFATLMAVEGVAAARTFRRLLETRLDLAGTEKQLVEREEKYRLLAENVADVTWTSGLGLSLNYMSPSIKGITGYTPEEAMALKLEEFYAPESMQIAIEAFREEMEIEESGKGDPDRTRKLELQLKCKDGSVVWTETNVSFVRDESGTLVGLGGVMRDISERKEIEDQLRQSQKMEAIGMLAGGIAHDFNNLLTVIIGHSELVLMRHGSEHPMSSDLEQIRQAGERAAALIRQLLAFSRQQVLEPSVLNLNEVVKHVEKLLLRTIGEDVELVLGLEPQLDAVKVDRTQMEQVLLNLAVNARDAMPGGGRLTLATTNIELGTNVPGDASFQTKPGAYIKLVVSDTGSGMDEETRERIFHPFFTTKEQGKGTGLGLSTVYGIVKQSEGYIWVESELDQGTTFHIFLPRTEDAVETTEEASRVPDSERSSNQTILLVEDERGVREFAVKALQQKGYRVVVAQHSEEALQVCEGHTGPIDLLVTDMVMPGSTGQELAIEILGLWPKTRVLYMSGYSYGSRSTDDSASAFLAKPFSAGELTQKVREVLESG